MLIPLLTSHRVHVSSPSSGVPSLGTALASVEPCSGTKALPALTLGTA